LNIALDYYTIDVLGLTRNHYSYPDCAFSHAD